MLLAFGTAHSENWFPATKAKPFEINRWSNCNVRIPSRQIRESSDGLFVKYVDVQNAGRGERMRRDLDPNNYWDWKAAFLS